MGAARVELLQQLATPADRSRGSESRALAAHLATPAWFASALLWLWDAATSE